MVDLRNVCSECKNSFPPSELVECPVCSGRLVISQKTEAPAPSPITLPVEIEPEPDFTGEGEPITDSDPGSVSQDNGDSIYPG